MANTTTAQATRDRVLQLAREIESLSHEDIPQQQFFKKFMDLMVKALGARAGAVWLLGGGRMNLAAEVGLAETGFKDNPQAPVLNHKLLAGVMSDGQAVTHAPDDPGAQLPTPHLIVLAALYGDKECLGVVQIFQRPDAPKEARPGYLQFVEQMTGYASRYIERQKQGHTAPDPSKFWDDFEQYVLQLQRTLDVQEVSSTTVNDGRLLLNCDRMSIAVKRGKKVSIKAVSGEDVVNARSNLIRSMCKLCDRTMAMRERVHYAGKVENLAPQIEEPLANFIQESGSRMVLAVPLFESEPLVDSEEKEEERRKRDRRKAIGCLVVEQVNDSHPRPGLMEHVDLMADHVGAALYNSQMYNRLFLMPVWRFLGTCLEWFHGRKLAKTLAVVTLVAAVIASLVYIPWDYRVEGEGRLMPVTQREVFVTWDGDVESILVKGGQRVQAGQPLVQLRNDELQAELIAIRNQLNEKQQLKLTLEAQRDNLVRFGQGTREDLLRVDGQIQETKIEIRGLEKQHVILEERFDLLTIKAPIDGVVATFQVEEVLKGRPVRRGEILMEIMDDKDRWRLELEVEEQRMGHIYRAQDKLQKENLDIEFILATKTEATYHGHLADIATRADKNPELGAVFEVYATIDADDLPDENRRIGAEVRAKITCDKRSLGYVLFGDVIEFFRKQLWL